MRFDTVWTNLRHRAARFDNRSKPEGWLPPSLHHRVNTSMSWVNRLRRWVPVESLDVERVKFDMQRMQHPEISGIEYQQGELAGFEVREYLLEKWGRQCAYCGTQNVPLEVEHIVARSNGGSNRVSNLTLACRCCNRRKGQQSVEQFLRQNPERLKQIQAVAKTPLRDAAAVNATRNALFMVLLETSYRWKPGAALKLNSTANSWVYRKPMPWMRLASERW